ncbi:MAG: 4-hydroxy-tetrahydrodipicolinate reductase, partial [Oscillospiraceae bacterium]
PSLLDALLDYAIASKTPIVIATTGLSQEQIDNIHNAAKEIPVFFTANMSLGVNLLVELAKKATAVLGGQFDIEIIEKHHNKKIDAPSGTALMIADSISSELSEQPEYVYDRQCKREKRSANEIGLHSVRGGTIVGEHEVIFAGPDEILSISHTAMSKEIFATGAINAALYICEKQHGLYSMKDLI